MKRSGCNTPNKSSLSNLNTHSFASTVVSAKEIQVTKVLFTLQWRFMTQILLALPVISLFVCLITSLIFHADHINNTICKVRIFTSFIESICAHILLFISHIFMPQMWLATTCINAIQALTKSF